MKSPRFLVTCEHGGNRVPAEYQSLFAGSKRLLNSHRGYDPGALPIARALAAHLEADLVFSQVTRLLVDLNRTAPRNLFSELSRHLSRAERERVLQTHYVPHRTRVVESVQRVRGGARLVIHIGVHTFVPILHGRRRTADIGLLYDPARRNELSLCRKWQKALQAGCPGWRIRRNYPYRGSDDGLTTYLRTRFPERGYCGLELEVNQSLAGEGGAGSAAVARACAAALRDALGCPR